MRPAIALRYSLFPLILGGSLYGAKLLLDTGLAPGVVAFVAAVANLALVAGLEQLLPRKPGVALLRDPQAPHDLLHGAMLSVIGVPLGQMLAMVFVTGLAGAASEAGPQLYWPDEWPSLAQFALALLIADFFDYWKHRAYHRFDWLWWFHSIHHSAADGIHALKAGRLHFMEGVFRYFVVTAPLALLGAPAELLFWYAMLDNFRGNLNHTNLDLRFPRFAHYLFPTLQYHYLHHARERRLQDSNYSWALYDIAFGTFHDPTRHAVAAVGIEDDPTPRGFLAQVVFPFRHLLGVRATAGRSALR